MTRLKVLQVGFGPLGRRLVADLLGVGHAVEQIVDSNPAAGIDAPAPVVLDVDDVVDWDKIDVAMVTTCSTLPDCADTFRQLLKMGKAVVSSCEELSYPWLRHHALATELDEVAKRNGGRLLGTGINPGFLMDAMPGLISTVCLEIHGIRVTRRQNARLRRIPFQQKIGAGLSPAAIQEGWAAGKLGHVGLGESLHLLADMTGLAIDDWTEVAEPIGNGAIASGIRQVATGFAHGRTLLELRFEAALDLDNPHDRVEITGTPPIDVVFHGGVPGDIGTSAVLIRSIPRLFQAPPGLHTVATLPIGRRQP